MSFIKGLKKKKAIGKDNSNPVVTNQLSTMDAENNRLDPNAFTEINPDAGQTKTASKKKKHIKTFMDGFVPTVKDPAPKNDPMRLYPGPEQPWNISGSDKVATAAGGLGPLKPPSFSSVGAQPTLKTMSSPKRVTPDIGAYGAPKGAEGVFGKRVSPPFKKSFGNFGHKVRQGMKSMTGLKRGL